MEFQLTPESISIAAGVVLSLLFSYLPGLSDWFYRQTDTIKRLVMLALLAAVTGGAFGLGCAGILKGVDCSQAGAVAIVWAFIQAMIANQATNAISPRTGAREYKAYTSTAKLISPEPKANPEA
jgi:hypothetical protein